MPNLDTVYRPGEVEARWSQIWLDRGLFRADADSRAAGSYCIVIPPPNITGSLHVGHALNNTLQDILIRWHRMRGDATLWQPGTDHAGIATQNVVERQLKAEGASRETLGRKAFIKRVWTWRKESGGRIIEQLKRLGASCDWSRERFTLGDGTEGHQMVQAVRTAFVQLCDDRLIYRGERLINWCTRCGTALSDIEVEHEEVPGKMYYIRYPLADSPNEFLTVATTRPETMLGDTAVAVHPEDPRYNSLIGKQILLPLTSRKIPIVGDAILVDREFGTGAVKITPAHDFNDFEAGERHRLPKISVLNEKGQVQGFLDQEGVDSQVLEDIAYLDVPKARARIEYWLNERNSLVKVEDHKHTIGKCYRCKSIVEPFLSPQWFVRVNAPHNSLAQRAIDAVRQKEIRLIPETWEPNYFGWMENIKDWCISRQIWWGHQIPAWYCKQCNAGKLGDGEYNRALPQKPLTGHPGETEIPQSQKETWPWISADAKPIVATAQPTHCKDCGGNAFIQDPDVLDTWFSSALWPFSTLGWPDEHSEFYKKFYPTSTLVTSFDILFFWVARMIMMGLHFTKQVPFKDVYIHALVRDAEGQKMSKSKGNVIDPLSIMDQYGTDALRFTLAAMASPGRDVKLSEQRIEGYRNFANKLWNAARFVLMNTEGHAIQHDPTQRSLADRWITIRLHRHINTVWQDLEAYRFDETANHLYQFVWHEFCDWYIELAKPRLAPDTPPEDAAATRATMVSTLETTLRLLHPLMPFITEEIWQKVPHHGDTIVRAVFPQPEPVSIEDQVVEGIMTDVIAVITAIRTTRSELNVAPVQLLRAGLKTSAATAKRLLDYGEQDICRLARLSQFHVGPEVSAPSSAVVNATAVGELFVVLEGLDREKERARIQKTLDAAHVELVRLDAKLKNPQFVTKAPADVVADHERRQSELRQQTLLLAEQIRRFGSGTSTP